ncbi:MAG: hypothetical protein ABL872_10065 [Lacibacter sp.]
MQYFKTILTVFLLAAFSIPLISPVVLQVKQLYVQWQMLEALEKQELVEVKIKTSNIEWIKDKKECWVNGEMFDVKHIQIINDETLLTGLYDKKEKEIKKSLKDVAKNQQQSGKLQQFVKLFSVMITNTETGNLPVPGYININNRNHFRNLIYITPFIGHIAPPPKLS